MIILNNVPLALRFVISKVPGCPRIKYPVSSTGQATQVRHDGQTEFTNKLQLVVPFQAACGDDPEELFGSQGFRLSVDPESQMAVFFADAKRKDLLQVEEATGDVFPLFVVDRFDVAPVILRLFNVSVRIKRCGN